MVVDCIVVSSYASFFIHIIRFIIVGDDIVEGEVKLPSQTDLDGMKNHDDLIPKN